MCGIVGYVGPKKVVPVIIEGLRRLEYRGYDSAGIAVGSPDSKTLEVRRAPGQRPELHLSGRAAEVAVRRGIARLSLSLSHSREFAIAVVVAEDDGR